MREQVDFLHWQRVHVGTQADPSAGGIGTRAVAQHADHAGATDAAMRLDTKTFKPVGYQISRSRLFKSQLGIGVNIAPPGGHLCVLALNRG